MKMREGLAFAALLVAMGLAFALNHAGKPIWFSLLAGFGVGIGIYTLLSRIRPKRNDQ